MRRVLFPMATLGVALLNAGCHHKHARVKTAHQAHPHQAQPIAVGTTEEGTASWYGVPYHGRPAADGEIYNMEDLVAAHRTLPFNTWLEVTNLVNGRSVNVRVIDRGPFVDGRIIDLSKGAARQLEMLGPGTARVRIRVVSAPAVTLPQSYYGVQVGAFRSRDNAERIRAQYADRLGYAQIELKQGTVPLYRVIAGKEDTEQSAQQLAAELRTQAGAVFVVRLDAPLNGGTNPLPQNTRPDQPPADH